MERRRARPAARDPAVARYRRSYRTSPCGASAQPAARPDPARTATVSGPSPARPSSSAACRSRSKRLADLVPAHPEPGQRVAGLMPGVLAEAEPCGRRHRAAMPWRRQHTPMPCRSGRARRAQRPAQGVAARCPAAGQGRTPCPSAPGRRAVIAIAPACRGRQRRPAGPSAAARLTPPGTTTPRPNRLPHIRPTSRSTRSLCSPNLAVATARPAASASRVAVSRCAASRSSSACRTRIRPARHGTSGTPASCSSGMAVRQRVRDRCHALGPLGQQHAVADAGSCSNRFSMPRCL